MFNSYAFIIFLMAILAIFFAGITKSIIPVVILSFVIAGSYHAIKRTILSKDK